MKIFNVKYRPRTPDEALEGTNKPCTTIKKTPWRLVSVVETGAAHDTTSSREKTIFNPEKTSPKQQRYSVAINQFN